MDAADRSNIDEQLRKEELWLSRLTQNLESSRTNKDSMIKLLDSFIQRLDTLEGTVLPLYQHTSQLQRRHQNISKTTKVIDNTLGFYSMATEVDSTIKDMNPGDDLQKYLSRMSKLSQATEFFKEQPKQLESVKNIFEYGIGSLQTEFKKTLQQCHPPSVNDLSACVPEGEVLKQKVSALELITPPNLEKLQHISAWLINNSRVRDFISVYASLRAETNLRALRDFVDARNRDLKRKFGSAPSAPAGTGSGNASPIVPSNRKESSGGRISAVSCVGPSKPRKFSDIIPRRIGARAGTALYAGEPTMRRVTQVLNQPQQHGGDYVYEDDAETFLTLILFMQVLVLREGELLRETFPGPLVPKIQQALMAKPVAYVMDQGEELLRLVNQAQTNRDYTSMFCLFYISKYFSEHTQQFEEILEPAKPEQRQQFIDLQRSITALCIKSLEDFKNAVTSPGDRTVPPDGTVLQATSSVVIFLEQLLHYRESLEQILSTKIEGPQEDGSGMAVPRYFSKVLSGLGLNLTNRGESVKDQTLKSLFMLNNYNHILKGLRSSGALKVVCELNQDVAAYYDSLIRQYKTSYHQSWAPVVTALSGADMLNATAGQLREADRKSLKDSFATFNKEFEQTLAAQKSYSVPDNELMRMVIVEVKELITPRYKQFYEKWASVQFSKTTDKYVRYTPDEVKGKVEGLFQA